jgi:hypothetical protein
MQLKIIVQLHLIHESSNIICLFHHQGSSHGISRSIYIYMSWLCERWSASGNFTVDRTGYRDVDLAFGTGTTHCNKRRDESSHQFNYFKPVYYVVTYYDACKP